MNSDILLESLTRNTRILLNDDFYYGELKEATDALFAVLEEASELDENATNHRSDCYLDSGKAIGTYWAGRCLTEFMRTRKFLLGIRDGIRDLQKQFPNEVIHILYAGTGPFATLLTPLTTIFDSTEIQITGIEINTESINCLKRIIASLKIEDYFKEIIQCDATTYKKAPNDKIHMIITETMLNGLQKEPQVAITQNLVPQLTDGGLLIPKNIKLTINLVDYNTKTKQLLANAPKQESFFLEVSPLIDLNQATCNDEKIYQNIEVHSPEVVEERFDEVNLFTTIQVYGEHILDYNECSLTLPITFKELSPSDLSNNRIVFDYVFGSHPKFEYRII